MSKGHLIGVPIAECGNQHYTISQTSEPDVKTAHKIRRIVAVLLNGLRPHPCGQTYWLSFYDSWDHMQQCVTETTEPNIRARLLLQYKRWVRQVMLGTLDAELRVVRRKKTLERLA